MYGQSNCHGKVFRKKLHSRTATVGEALVCERAPKTSICCACEKRRDYHRTFTSKAVTGVFAVFATEKYTVTSVSVEREHVE